MSLDELMANLQKELEERPHSSNAWIELARAVAHTATFPDFLDPDEHLPYLTQLWKLAPENRSLGALWFPLAGLRALGRTDDPPGPWWESENRLGTAEDHFYDALHGLPLRAREPRSGCKLLWIPPGHFTMGVDAAEVGPVGEDQVAGSKRSLDVEHTGEAQRHEVEVDGFWIGHDPVMVESYRLFVEATGHNPPPAWDEQLLEPGRPVIGVDWDSAAAFAGWAGGRLPTEAEWEYAARGPHSLYYPWGEKSEGCTDEHAHFFKAQTGGPLDQWKTRLPRVSSLKESVSPFGARDMLGLVWEWCSDWWAPFTDIAVRNPTGSQEGDRRVARGGSWASAGKSLRSTLRVGLDPGTRSFDVGFRIVRPVVLAAGDAGAPLHGDEGPVLSSMVMAVPAEKLRKKSKGIFDDLFGDPLPVNVTARMGTARLQHAGAVRALTFSKSGHQLYTAGDDGTIRFWDSFEGKEVARLCELPMGLTCLTRSSDGRFLISGGRDMAVRIWEIKGRKELLCIRGFRKAIASVAIDQAGHTVASASVAGVVRVLDLRTKKRTHKFQVDGGADLQVLFTREGGLLLIGGGAGVIRRFDLETGGELEPIEIAPSGSAEVVRHFALSPEPNRLVVSSEDEAGTRVSEWDPVSGHMVQERVGKDLPRVLAFTEASMRFSAGITPGRVRLTSLDGRTQVRAFGPEGVDAVCLALSPGADHLAAGYESGVVEIWNTSNGEPVFHAAMHHGRPTAMVTGATGRQVVTAGRDRNVFVWFGKTGKRDVAVEMRGEVPTALGLSPDELTLAIGQESGKLQIFNLLEKQPMAFHEPFDQEILALAFGKDGNNCLAGLRDGGIHSYQWRPVKRSATMIEPAGEAVRFAFLPLRNLAARARADGPVELVDLKVGEIFHTLGEEGSPASALCFTRDGKHLLIGKPDPAIAIHEVTTGKLVQNILDAPGGVRAVAITPDGKHLAGAGGGGTITLWDLATGTQQAELEGHAGAVLALAFADEGKILYSLATDRTVLAWDMAKYL